MALTKAAKVARLRGFEEELEGLLQGYRRMGFIWKTIRDEELWKLEYTSFHEYCVCRWDVTGQTVVASIKAYEVAEDVVAAGVPAPTYKSEAIELGKLSKEERADAFREVIKKTRGKPNTPAVKTEVKKRQAKAQKGSRTGRMSTLYRWLAVPQLRLRNEIMEYVEDACKVRKISVEGYIRDLIEEDYKRALKATKV